MCSSVIAIDTCWFSLPDNTLHFFENRTLIFIWRASQVSVVVKKKICLAMLEMLRDVGWIPGLRRSPGEGSGTLLSILAWKIPWAEEPGGLLSMGHKESRHDWATEHKTFSTVKRTQTCTKSPKIWIKFLLWPFTICLEHFLSPYWVECFLNM